MITTLIPSFNSGELSPLIHLRSDLDKYRSGCRTLENMLITPYGGVRRRPGLQFCGRAKAKGRVFTFQYSVSDAYVLVFTAYSVRVFLNGQPVQATNVTGWTSGILYGFGNWVNVAGVIYHCTQPHSSGVFAADLAAGKWVIQSEYEFPTGYTEAQIKDLQMCQINNVAYFTHPEVAPWKLVRNSDTNWAMAPVPFDYYPMREENVRIEQKMTVSGASPAGGAAVQVSTNFPLFSTGHVLAYFEVKTERKASQFEISLAATLANDGVNSGTLVVQGKWNFTTKGTWDGVFVIDRSDNDGGTWTQIRRFDSRADANFTATGNEPSRVLLRLYYAHRNIGSSAPKATLEAEGTFIKGLMKCVGVTNPYLATFVPITALEGGITSYWSEGAWSGYRGFPRTVCAHEQRLVFGGNTSEPQTLWASKVDDYENFEKGVKDDDSWNHTLAANQQDSIQWLVSGKHLLIGTSGSEWVMSAGRDDGIITPTSVRARRHSSHGSNYLPATMAGNAVLFVQRGGRKVREMSFDFNQDGYKSVDLTLLAEHICEEGGITGVALQGQRDTVLWAVTASKKLIGLTYERDQAIAGWARHVTGNPSEGFESVCVVARAGEEDEVYVLVSRSSGYTIERFAPDQFREQVSGNLSELFFVDSGVKLRSATPVNQLAGLGHLSGRMVQIVADGMILEPRLVNGDKIMLDPTVYANDPDTAYTLTAGLPYTSLLEPLTLEMGMQNGTSVSRQKRIHEVAIYFDQSGGCMVSSKKSGPFDNLPFLTGDMASASAQPLFTGLIKHALDARHDLDASLVIKQDQPVPMTIAAIVPKWNIYGDNN
jgi:hypothetical protein